MSVHFLELPRCVPIGYLGHKHRGQAKTVCLSLSSIDINVDMLLNTVHVFNDIICISTLALLNLYGVEVVNYLLHLRTLLETI